MLHIRCALPSWEPGELSGSCAGCHTATGQAWVQENEHRMLLCRAGAPSCAVSGRLARRRQSSDARRGRRCSRGAAGCRLAGYSKEQQKQTSANTNRRRCSPSRKPFLKRRCTSFRWRMRPVPVVLRPMAFTLQLSAVRHVPTGAHCSGPAARIQRPPRGPATLDGPPAAILLGAWPPVAADRPCPGAMLAD